MRLTLTTEQDYPTAADRVQELWTTAAGIESWWAPDGFEVHVDTLDLRAGGTLTYTMTATGPEQVAYMEGTGLPLSTTSTKTFTVVEPHRRLAYSTLADFIPGVEPYEFPHRSRAHPHRRRRPRDDDRRRDARPGVDRAPARRAGGDGLLVIP
ncbi:SRPBCC family protein [Streptacidiphilus pinicola]|uniref:SRPBCC family protein n=1 Tax=Streptacidiphilus pinicola TaxID=2219663 RepID=UPI001AA00283|nr:SRPBCC domain-containing protein [Streptacidiphilus pinicola]